MRPLTAILLVGASCFGQAPAVPPKLEGVVRHQYKQTASRPLYLYSLSPAKTDSPRPAIVFFFGGGWKGGTTDQFADQARHLTARGMVSIHCRRRILHLQYNGSSNQRVDRSAAAGGLSAAVSIPLRRVRPRPQVCRRSGRVSEGQRGEACADQRYRTHKMITASSKCLPRKNAGQFRFTDLPYQTYPGAFATEPVDHRKFGLASA